VCVGWKMFKKISAPSIEKSTKNGIETRSHFDPSGKGAGARSGLMNALNTITISPNSNMDILVEKESEVLLYIVSGEVVKSAKSGDETLKAGTVKCFHSMKDSITFTLSNKSQNPAQFVELHIQTPNKPLSQKENKVESVICNDEDLKDTIKTIGSSKIDYDDAVSFHQDVQVYACKGTPNQILHFDFQPRRQVYIACLSGGACVIDVEGEGMEGEGVELIAGDGAVVLSEGGGGELQLDAVGEKEDEDGLPTVFRTGVDGVHLFIIETAPLPNVQEAVLDGAHPAL